MSNSTCQANKAGLIFKLSAQSYVNYKIIPSKNGSESKTVNVMSKWPTDCYVFPMEHSDIPCSQIEKVLPSISNQEQTLQVALMAAVLFR